MNISSDDWTGIGNPKKIVPPPEGWPERMPNWPFAIGMLIVVVIMFIPMITGIIK